MSSREDAVSGQVSWIIRVSSPVCQLGFFQWKPWYLPSPGIAKHIVCAVNSVINLTSSLRQLSMKECYSLCSGMISDQATCAHFLKQIRARFAWPHRGTEQSRYSNRRAQYRSPNIASCSHHRLGLHLTKQNIYTKPCTCHQKLYPCLPGDKSMAWFSFVDIFYNVLNCYCSYFILRWSFSPLNTSPCPASLIPSENISKCLHFNLVLAIWLFILFIFS